MVAEAQCHPLAWQTAKRFLLSLLWEKKEKRENMTRVLKMLRCVPQSASRCHENWETPTSRPGCQRRAGSPAGNSLAGSCSAPALLQLVPFGAWLMETFSALSFSLGCTAPRTDLGRERPRLPKHPPTTASKWDTASVLPSSLLCSAIKPLSASTLKSH